MDAGKFDALARTLILDRSRRSAVAAAFAGSLSLLGVIHPDEAAAKKPCPPCKKRKQGKCKGKKPDGSPCADGKCLSGRCQPTTPPPPPRCPDPFFPNHCPITGACMANCLGGKVFAPNSCTCQCVETSCCTCNGGSNPFCSPEFSTQAECIAACVERNPGAFGVAFNKQAGISYTCNPNTSCGITCNP